ncbi:MAG: hypothetical protein AAGE96_04950 [Cyanobacteria bacterium P01_G01_bin.19]
MSYRIVGRKSPKSIDNSTLILFGYATAFFPRLFSYFGVPPTINFVHFLTIPIIFIIAIFTAKPRNTRQIAIVWELVVALGILLICTIASALINEAGAINVFLQYILQAEPFLLLIAIMSIPMQGQNFYKFKNWLFGFALFNLLLAIAQSFLIPLGIYPRRGGTIADNIAGVFASSRGSAGNYVSCSVSLYFALYFFLVFKKVPLWIRITGLLAAVYQTQVSDSKQVFLAFIVGAIILLITKSDNPKKLLIYFTVTIIFLTVSFWAIKNLEADFLTPYQNWINRSHIYGPDGEATQTKLAAFRIIPTHFNSPLNWLFGLGPGHTVGRLGGWMMQKYSDLLVPMGGTLHPASAEVFQVVRSGWIAKQSTIFFPLFTWVGIWGDQGIVGLGAYIYLGSIVWRKVCVDDLGRFLILSTVVLGFILTQMEEPGHMLTIVCLLGLRWHEEQERRAQNQVNF